MLNPFAGTKDWAWSRWQGGQARVAPDRDLGQNYAYVLEKETEKSFEMIMGLVLAELAEQKQGFSKPWLFLGSTFPGGLDRGPCEVIVCIMVIASSLL